MKISNGFLTACALLLSLQGPVRAQEASADTVIATVNGVTITLGNVIVLRQSLPEQYQSLPDDVLYNGLVEQLVQQVVLEQTLGDKLTRRDQLRIENDRRNYLSGVVLQDVVTKAVTEEAVKAAYDARVKSATPVTEYNAAHILVATEDEAKSLKADLDGGADFAVLAAAQSTDTGSAVNGGDLGWFGPGMMVKPFEDAVIAMKPGEVAGPIQTQFGWHLIKLKETRVAPQPTLEDLRDELAGEVEQKAIADFLKPLTDAAKIEKPATTLDPALMRKDDLVAN
ncbi:MAG: peptidylprolyl isomerase [Pseudomonadota bacterium]